MYFSIFSINFSYIIVNKSKRSTIGCWTILSKYRESANLVLATLKCTSLLPFQFFVFLPQYYFFKIFYSMYTIYTFIYILFMYII